MTRQPENFLYNENTYQLPGPAPVLATHSSGGGGLQPSGGEPPGHGPTSEAKSPPEWLLYVIWRQKWLILTTMVLAAMAAVFYLNYATPMYASTAKVYVQQLNVAINPGGAPESQSINYLNTQKEVLTSEPVLAVASTLKDVLQSDELKDVKDPVAHLKAIISAEVDRGDDLIRVTALSPSAHDAAVVVNGVVDAYKGFQTRTLRTLESSTGFTLDVLKQKKAEVEASVAARIQTLSKMESQYDLLSHQDPNANIVFRRLQAISEGLTNAQTDAIDAKMSYEEAALTYNVAATQPSNTQARPDPDDPEIPITSAPEMAVLRSEMLQTQTQLHGLEQRFLPEHPEVIRLRHRLSALNRNYVAAVHRRWLVCQRRVEDMQRQYEEEHKHASELDAKRAEYDRVQEDLNRDKALRDSYDAKIHDIELSRDAGALNISVLEKGQVEVRPSYPNPVRVMPIALAMGLCLGILLACMREWVDDRFRTASEIKSSLGMPLLAVIPNTTTKRSPSVSGQRVLLDPGSDTAEAYRSLRAAILYSAPAGQLKSLLVTSPSSGDGKTTLVSNLAIAMAQGGRKVLIIDADLRNPTQHDIFGVKNNTGLSALLAGRSTPETAVQRSHVPNLDILPCGPTPANPAEILNSREFGEALESLSDKYDCVVLDSPPVEAVADARIIAASCDATLIVLKAQTAHRRTTEHTRDSLTSVGARVLGVVVNDLPRRASNTYGKNSANRRYVPGLTGQPADAAQTQVKK
jgi:capsular exopolysaccharide synthesis family protein